MLETNTELIPGSLLPRTGYYLSSLKQDDEKRILERGSLSPPPFQGQSNYAAWSTLEQEDNSQLVQSSATQLQETILTLHVFPNPVGIPSSSCFLHNLT